MFGAVKQASAWAWGASGKHPVVKDYISLGTQSPLMNAYSRWVEEGYSRLEDRTPVHSWRFFAKGMKPQELSCGLLKDSHDGAGRPFPLLIMGYGPFTGWEGQWDHIPSVLEAVWERLEFLCAKRVFDLEELKRDIDRLPSPVIAGKGSPGTMAGHEVPMGQDGRFSVHLGESGDHPEEIRQWLASFKAHLNSVPEAIFIGGPLEKSFLAVFTRPLDPADLEWLWIMN